jgi:hypothetical protein
MTVAGVDLSATGFWGLPLPDRAASFAVLRRPHFCLGAHLARRERLLSSFVDGIKRLPCQFTA